jgi:hypothetical protein
MQARWLARLANSRLHQQVNRAARKGGPFHLLTFFLVKLVTLIHLLNLVQAPTCHFRENGNPCFSRHRYISTDIS